MKHLKTTEERTEAIIKDLYKLDPSFTKHAPELRTIVADLITLQPDTHFDESFAQQLKSSLMIEAHTGVHTASRFEKIVSPFSSLFATRLFTGLAGAMMAIIIVAPLTYLATKKTIQVSPEVAVKNISSGLSLKQQINNKGTNAFGTLAYLPVSSNANNTATADAMTKSASPEVSNQSMSAFGAASTDPTNGVENFTYIYKGEPLKLSQTEGTVLKRTKGINAGNQLADFIKGANFGLTNLESFSQLNLQNIQLSENKDFGYTVNVNFDEGNMVIMQNWQKWNVKTDRVELPASSSLDDDTILSIAQTFIKDRGIDTSIYGKAVVENKIYSNPDASGKMKKYAYDTVIVTYPLILDGKEVYDEGGMRYGLQVNVDIREKKVSGINNLTSQLYESSKYALETDAQKIIDAATSTANPSAQTRVSTTKTIELGSPKQVLMRNWTTDASGVTTEIYVPALLFGVKQNSNLSNIPQNIIVPLIKDVTNQVKNSKPDAVPMPRPTGEPIVTDPIVVPIATSTATTSSETSATTTTE
ncbi:MAG: hypothetical protein V4519_02650 [Patescibacteria group bacterium]